MPSLPTAAEVGLGRNSHALAHLVDDKAPVALYFAPLTEAIHARYFVSSYTHCQYAIRCFGLFLAGALCLTEVTMITQGITIDDGLFVLAIHYKQYMLHVIQFHWSMHILKCEHRTGINVTVCMN